MRTVVEPLIFPSNEEHPVAARIALGLTVYLADPLTWAEHAAARVLDSFIRLPGSRTLGWFTTSQLPEWHAVEPDGLPALLEALSAWTFTRGRPRHLFSFQLVDDTGAPSMGFRYHEVDPERTDRTGILEITLPQESAPEELLQLALQIGNLGGFVAGVGGYAARWNPFEKRLAFDQIYLWCQRYRGLDVQDPEEMAWAVGRGLPGTGWLTMVGDAEPASRLGIDIGAIREHAFRNDVAVIPVRHGAVIRAGALPTLGDANMLSYPWAYAEVARHLAPALVREPPALWGMFGGLGHTEPWLRRFVEPKGWR